MCSSPSCRWLGDLQNPTTQLLVNIIKVRLLSILVLTSGVFSGFWVMDPEGAWNGSVFTLVVTDTQPHFFYSISMDGWYLKNCSKLLEYHSSFTIPDGSDVIFALNPVNPILIVQLTKVIRRQLRWIQTASGSFSWSRRDIPV